MSHYWFAHARLVIKLYRGDSTRPLAQRANTNLRMSRARANQSRHLILLATFFKNYFIGSIHSITLSKVWGVPWSLCLLPLGAVLVFLIRDSANFDGHPGLPLFEIAICGRPLEVSTRGPETTNAFAVCTHLVGRKLFGQLLYRRHDVRPRFRRHRPVAQRAVAVPSVRPRGHPDQFWPPSGVSTIPSWRVRSAAGSSFSVVVTLSASTDV